MTSHDIGHQSPAGNQDAEQDQHGEETASATKTEKLQGCVSLSLGRTMEVVSHIASMGLAYLPTLRNKFMVNVSKYTIHGWYGFEL